MFDWMHIFVRMFVIHHRFTHLKKQIFEFNLSRLALLLRCDCCLHKFLCFFFQFPYKFFDFIHFSFPTLQQFRCFTSKHSSTHFMDHFISWTYWDRVIDRMTFFHTIGGKVRGREREREKCVCVCMHSAKVQIMKRCLFTYCVNCTWQNRNRVYNSVFVKIAGGRAREGGTETESERVRESESLR